NGVSWSRFDPTLRFVVLYVNEAYPTYALYLLARDAIVVVIRSREYEASFSSLRNPVHLSHSLPNLKLRTNSPKAPKRKDKPRATRNTANARTTIDETPRPLYVLTVVHAAPPNRIMPIAISTSRIALVNSETGWPKG